MASDAATSHTNRLINETSPYLLQHAHNPVDWYAWGEEAFTAAREQGKPIFLSIGYSTCYWCHVMERESFEHEEIAALMNEHCVCIKVDREERPDVDDIYMTATQLMTQHGGWPMSVWLEPKSLKPFFAGTYFPPRDHFGRIGFPNVLTQIAQAWREQRDVVERQAEQVAEAVRKTLAQPASPVKLRTEHVEQTIDMLMRYYDREHGGFGGTSGPKFPTPVNLEFLIGAAWAREDVRNAVLHTLDRMATGGMYDQIGGGFHRYSVDAMWLVPHFEKMLYDNAQLAGTYSRAYELAGDPFYAEIVRETLEYVLREMTDEKGGFWSAQDAEVNAREGQNYLWTATEVREVLAEAGMSDLADVALDVYGLTDGTNFRDPHHPEDGPKNVVHLLDRPEQLAASRNLTLETFNNRIEKINHVLLKARDNRDQPGTDDKVLAGWNGLMIAGMAEGGRVLGEPMFIEAAKRAAEFVLKTMRGKGGSLQRTYRNGEAKIDALAEDYAFIIRGLLALHRAADEQRWLDEAQQLAATMRRLFFDESSGGGGFFDTREGQSDLFVRIKGTYDGAVPSANSVMLVNLIELHERTGDEQYLRDAQATLAFLSRVISERPVASTLAVLGLARMIEGGEDASVGEGEGGETASDVVRVWVEPENISLHADKETLIRVHLDIAEGYHIYVHADEPTGIEPLCIEVAGSGIAAEVAYPQGEPYQGGSGLPEARIHRGTIAVPVRLLPSTGGEGPLRVIVSYQSCSESECLAPRSRVLPVSVNQRERSAARRG